MNKQLPEFITLANRMGFRVNFSSNGSLAVKQVVDRLIANKARYNICVDFAADPEFYESIRGGEGSHKIVLENLKYLVQQSIKMEGFSVTITDISAFDLDKLKNQDKSFSDLKHLFNNVRHKNVRFNKRIFHNVDGVFVANKLEEKTSYRLCIYPWFMMCINWRGDVVPCSRDWKYDSVVGNVFETDSLYDIWTNQKFKSLRESLIKKHPEDVPACRKCDMPFDSSRWSPAYVIDQIRKRYFRSI